jgi:asparagine synthase (glutamine-hydrolysing)
MCGIAGSIALGTSATPVSIELLTKMADAMAHRGPDGSGVWLHPNGRVGFSHRRLSIIDLDERAAQPMQDRAGALTVTFNGEIYNHRTLRRELEALGRQFRTDHSDTEVLIEGYRAWGIAGLLHRLAGMFAFALHDADTGTVHIARDRLGIKPVYFTESGGRLWFASEIKALLGLPGTERGVDLAALYHFLTFLVTPAPASLFAGIAKLPAGHVITVRPDGAVSIERWWKPELHIGKTSGAGASSMSRSELVARTRALLELSMDRHMVADVPVGVFLSGGVDSSAVLSLASRRSERPLRTFTVGFADAPDLNELEQARNVAQLHGAEYDEVVIDERDALDSLDAIVRHQDEPLADWVCIPLWHVAQLAHKSGTKAILVGEGADELFLGYASYQRFLKLAERAMQLRRIAPIGTGSVIDAAAALVPIERMGLRGLLDHAKRAMTGGEVFWSGAVSFWETQKKAILQRSPAPAPGWPAYGLRGAGLDTRSSHHVVAELLAEAEGRAPHDRLRVSELRLRLPELLLMRVDKMTMAHSLEARVPFLDHELVEFALGLDHETLLNEGIGKSVLKEAVAGLVPREILLAQKRGFGAPMGRWLQGRMGHELERIVLQSDLANLACFDKRAIAQLFAAHRKGRRDLSLFLWPLINASLWYDHYIGRNTA